MQSSGHIAYLFMNGKLILRKYTFQHYLTRIRACGCMGLSPLNSLDTWRESENDRGLIHKISPSLRFQLELTFIVSRCFTSISENGLRNLTTTQERSLKILLRAFETQFKNLEVVAGSLSSIKGSIIFQFTELMHLRQGASMSSYMPSYYSNVLFLHEP